MNARVLSLLIGYIFGNFLTAYFVVGKITGRSPFEYGSGNPGMANVMANEGKGLGLMVLAGDILKTVLACILSAIFFLNAVGRICILYAGLGVTLGHNFPIWHSLKGGKGVATTCSAIVLFSPNFGMLANIIGGLVVLFTGWLPLAGVVIPLVYVFPAFYFYGTEAGILSLILLGLMIWAHHHGLLRIIHGQEKKIKLF
ncbi:MAG: glycerol-3-phosphate acyltransferase [Eubacterium sp.]|nr:glycerol-3-phosphate acyltransferase [Eubacterium sp.]